MSSEKLTNYNCLICGILTAKGDFVNLFDEEISDGILSPIGELYEELIGFELPRERSEFFPRRVCKSCELQMKLFKRLKEKAFTTWEKLNHMDVEIKQLQNKAMPTEGYLEQDNLCEDYSSYIIEENISPNENLSTSDQISLELKCETNNEEENLSAQYITNEEINPMLDDMEGNKNYEIVQKDLNLNVEVNNPLLVVVDYELRDEVVGSRSTVGTEIHSGDLNEYDDKGESLLVVDYLNTEDNDRMDFMTPTEENHITKKSRRGSKKVESSSSFKCKDCGLEFSTLILLKTHRQKDHHLMHICIDCSKAFRSAEALEAHTKQEHLGLPAYSCEQCGKNFKQKVHYQYHMKKHANERNYNCEECGKSYISKSDLSSHMRSHNGLRPYLCSFKDCGKTFYTEQHLKMHSYYHSDSKNFECDTCKQKFSSPTVLHTHRQTIHGMERRFTCTICEKKFRRKHHLEVHVQTHEKEKSQVYFPQVINYPDSCPSVERDEMKESYNQNIIIVEDKDFKPIPNENLLTESFNSNNNVEITGNQFFQIYDAS